MYSANTRVIEVDTTHIEFNLNVSLVIPFVVVLIVFRNVINIFVFRANPFKYD